jgi:hypothetical protein
MWPQNRYVFTLPIYGFVVALNLDWCPDANEAITKRRVESGEASKLAAQLTPIGVTIAAAGTKVGRPLKSWCWLRY